MAYTPPSPSILAAFDADRADTAGASLFGWPRGRLRLIHGGVIALAIATAFYNGVKRTALIAPIDPGVHALMIGLGVFVGIVVAAIERDAIDAGIGWRFGRKPGAFAVAMLMAAIVGGGAWGGSFVARAGVEWWAFRGLAPAAQQVEFTVAERESHKSSAFVGVRGYPGGRLIWLSSDWSAYRSAQIGDHIDLDVQTGRSGVQRALLRRVTEDALRPQRGQ